MKKLIWLLLLTSCVEIETYYPHEYTFNIIPDVNKTLYADFYRNGNYFTTEICNTDYVYVNENEDISILIADEPLNGQYITDHDMIFGIKQFKSDLSRYKWNDYNTDLSVILKPLMYDYRIEVVYEKQCDSVYVSGLSKYRHLLDGKNLSETYILGLKFPNTNQVDFKSFGPPNEGSWNVNITSEIILIIGDKFVIKDVILPPKGGLIRIRIDSIDDSSFPVEIEDWSETNFDIF